MTDFYSRDAAVVQVQIPNAAQMTAIDIPTVLPRFRGLSTIRPIDVNLNIITSSRENEIEVVEIGDIYDPVYRTIKNFIAYVSGSKVVVRCPVTNYGFAIEYFQAPKTRREEFDSWIAQLAPDIIQFWAAAIVLNTNGNEEKAKNYLLQVEKFYIPQLKSNFLTGAAR